MSIILAQKRVLAALNRNIHPNNGKAYSSLLIVLEHKIHLMEISDKCIVNSKSNNTTRTCKNI